jgi:hypothetical protein
MILQLQTLLLLLSLQFILGLLKLLHGVLLNNLPLHTQMLMNLVIPVESEYLPVLK